MEDHFTFLVLCWTSGVVRFMTQDKPVDAQKSPLLRFPQPPPPICLGETSKVGDFFQRSPSSANKAEITQESKTWALCVYKWFHVSRFDLRPFGEGISQFYSHSEMKCPHGEPAV